MTKSITQKLVEVIFKNNQKQPKNQKNNKRKPGKIKYRQ